MTEFFDQSGRKLENDPEYFADQATSYGTALMVLLEQTGVIDYQHDDDITGIFMKFLRMPYEGVRRRIEEGHHHFSDVDFYDGLIVLDSIEDMINQISSDVRFNFDDYQQLVEIRDKVYQLLLPHLDKQRLDDLAKEISALDNVEMSDHIPADMAKKRKVLMDQYMQLVRRYDQHPDAIKVYDGPENYID